MTAVITHCVSLPLTAKLRTQAVFCGAILFFCALMSPQKPTVCGVCKIRCFIYDVCTSLSANTIFMNFTENRYFWIDLVQNKKRLF